MLVDYEAGEDEPKWPSREGMRRRTKWYGAGKLSRSGKTLYLPILSTFVKAAADQIGKSHPPGKIQAE